MRTTTIIYVFIMFEMLRPVAYMEPGEQGSRPHCVPSSGLHRRDPEPLSSKSRAEGTHRKGRSWSLILYHIQTLA